MATLTTNRRYDSSTASHTILLLPPLNPTPDIALAKFPAPLLKLALILDSSDSVLNMLPHGRKRRLSSQQAQQLMKALSGIEWVLCGLCLILALPIAILVSQGFSVRWLIPLVMAAMLFCPLLYPINLTVKGIKLGLGMLVLVLGGVF